MTKLIFGMLALVFVRAVYPDPSGDAEAKILVPDFVKTALRDVPEDAMVGVGTAEKLASVNQSKILAQTNARGDLCHQLDEMLYEMIWDYQYYSDEVSLLDMLAFKGQITVALSKSALTGSWVVVDQDPDGYYWAVIMLSKSGVTTEINRAVATAKTAVPAMSSFAVGH